MVWKPKKRHIAYARVSTDYQHTVHQKRSLLAYIAQRTDVEFELIEETVTGKKMKGPKLTALREAVTQGKIAEILVYYVDRLGRNTKEGLIFIDECKDHNTVVRFTAFPSLDTDTPFGRMFFINLMSMAELEGSLISSRTKQGLLTASLTCAECNHYDESNRQEGQFLCVECGSAKARFWGGVRKGTKWMTAKVAKHVPEILRLFDAKVPRYKIAKLLGMDERTVSKIIRERNNLPPLRECLWDQ